MGKIASRISNLDLMKQNKLLLRVVKNKFKNLKPVCVKLKTNSIPNNAVLQKLSKLIGKWNAESKKSPTRVKKTRKPSPESKSLSTSFKSKSRPTNVKPKNQKNKLMPIFPSIASYNMNLTKLKNVPIWLNLLLTNFVLKPVKL